MNRRRGVVSFWLTAAAMALLVALFIVAGTAAAQVDQIDGFEFDREQTCVGGACNSGNEGTEECVGIDCWPPDAGATLMTQTQGELAPSEEAAQDQQAAEDSADEPASQSDPAPSAGENAPRASGSLPARLPNTGFPALALLGSGLSVAALALWRRRS